ncbi:hypothetical protein N8Z24_00570 [bacterium]|nr:hypothetical protein [bacterium]
MEKNCINCEKRYDCKLIENDCPDWEEDKKKIHCSFSFPDDSHETIHINCPCGRTAERTIDLGKVGEANTVYDRAVLHAAFVWIKSSPCGDCSWQLSDDGCRLLEETGHKAECYKLREAIKNHSEYKKPND